MGALSNKKFRKQLYEFVIVLLQIKYTPTPIVHKGIVKSTY